MMPLRFMFMVFQNTVLPGFMRSVPSGSGLLDLL